MKKEWYTEYRIFKSQNLKDLEMQMNEATHEEFYLKQFLIEQYRSTYIAVMWRQVRFETLKELEETKDDTESKQTG